MVYSLLVTLAATDTAQPLATVHTPATWVVLFADPANHDIIHHGGKNLTAANGDQIPAGGGGGSPQYPQVGVPSPYDLQQIFVIGAAGDSVRVRYFRR
jgi:hypothetical protein